MDDGFKTSMIVPLVALLLSGVGINLLIFWVIICPVLYKFGARFPTGLAFWRVPKELKAFRDVCSTHGKSFFPYVAFQILFWFNLTLAVVLALRVLWENTQPPS
jgi:hypothetical protein